jgi:hypothetical protein
MDRSAHRIRKLRSLGMALLILSCTSSHRPVSDLPNAWRSSGDSITGTQVESRTDEDRSKTNVDSLSERYYRVSGEIGMFKGIPKPFVDCNGNGVRDDVDVRELTVDDANGNGIPDDCERDTSLLASMMSQRWRCFKDRSDTTYFWAGYRPGGAVVIRYTIPRKAYVTLGILTPAGVRIATVLGETKMRGAYELVWHPQDDKGSRMPDGIYTLRLLVGDLEYIRRVRWQQL